MRLFRQSGERLGPAVALRLYDEVDHMLLESLEGQAMELGWVRDNDLSIGDDDYLRLVLKKTAWYSFIHPMRIGALVAGGNDADLGRFDRFGYLLGLAFQITDDVLNLEGGSGRYGKEIDGDLWEGKRTLVIAHALNHLHGADRTWIDNFLSRPRDRRLPREVVRLHDMLRWAAASNGPGDPAAAFAEAATVRQRYLHDVPAGLILNWFAQACGFPIREPPGPRPQVSSIAAGDHWRRARAGSPARGVSVDCRDEPWVAAEPCERAVPGRADRPGRHSQLRRQRLVAGGGAVEEGGDQRTLPIGEPLDGGVNRRAVLLPNQGALE
jgi:hypothetical protein